MTDCSGDYVYASVHEFKNNISKYTRLMERGIYKAVLVRRHSEVVGVYMTSVAKQLDEVVKAKIARKEGHNPPMPYDSSIFDV